MIHRAITLPFPRRRPHIAVIVPCYNYGHYLSDCVHSIISQEEVTTAVHIIDDASPDGSGLIAEEIADKYPNVKTTRHTRNLGHIETYNEGLSAADSDYVVLISADDMLTPGALGRATALMETYTSVGMVYGNPQVFTERPPLSVDRVRNWSVWRGDSWIRSQFRRSIGIISSPEAVVRTSIQHAAGYYRPELPHAGDLEMWLRIAAISDIGRINGPDQAFRRVHANSMMQTKYGTVIKDLVERSKAYESFLSSLPDTSLPDSRRTNSLRELMNRRMCQEALGWVCSVRGTVEASPQEISQAVSFAQEIYPQYAHLSVWHEYRMAGSRATKDRISRLTVRCHREVTDRLRWRRWRRYGI